MLSARGEGVIISLVAGWSSSKKKALAVLKEKSASVLRGKSLYYHSIGGTGCGKKERTLTSAAVHKRRGVSGLARESQGEKKRADTALEKPEEATEKNSSRA